MFTVEIENYLLFADYNQTLSYNKLGFFDIKILLLTPTSNTKIKVKFLDPSKILNKKGKTLKNSEASAEFPGESRFLGSSLSPKAINTTLDLARVIGAVTVSLATSLFTISGPCGFFLGAMAKFFQIIEFSRLLAFFNINFDLAIEVVLIFVEKIGDFDVFDLPFENAMKQKPENLVAAK